MIKYQVEQGNKANVSIFQKDCSSDKDSGGFNWNETREKTNFWGEILIDKRFDMFFEMYPKANVYYVGDFYKGKEVISKLKELGGINKHNYDGKSSQHFYVIAPITKEILKVDKFSELNKLWINNYTRKCLSD